MFLLLYFLGIMQNSKTIVDALFHTFIAPYEIPTTLHSDQKVIFK